VIYLKTEKDRELARQCINGLTLYAIERMLGFESDQSRSSGPLLNPEKRNASIRSIISDLASFWNLSENVEKDFIKPFDVHLSKAQSSFGAETANFDEQRAVVQGLSHYADELDKASDVRTKLLEIRNILEEIYAYLPWDALKLGVNPARDSIDRSLVSMTATRNILFTRVLLGSEYGPADSDFVSGVVINEPDVKSTELYEDLKYQYSEIEEWPAICTVYRAGYGRETAENASELDLQIMRETGDKFLNMEGITLCSMPFEFKIRESEEIAQTEQSLKL
jgi:hypothetical protein